MSKKIKRRRKKPSNFQKLRATNNPQGLIGPGWDPQDSKYGRAALRDLIWLNFEDLDPEARINRADQWYTFYLQSWACQAYLLACERQPTTPDGGEFGMPPGEAEDMLEHVRGMLRWIGERAFNPYMCNPTILDLFLHDFTATLVHCTGRRLASITIALRSVLDFLAAVGSRGAKDCLTHFERDVVESMADRLWGPDESLGIF